jgi:hypothetical protein
LVLHNTKNSFEGEGSRGVRMRNTKDGDVGSGGRRDGVLATTFIWGHPS